ncbi:MAG TPA: hypothetical protein VG755_14705 [Nannocystaceae bacterium]|nr:hypothetical protein [Nannocystaceae bacterium]
MTELQDALAKAEQELAGGDAHAAFTGLRNVLEFPATALADAPDYARAFATFARVAAAIAGSELAALVQRVASERADAQAYYDVGYALYEQKLFGIAATLLARANQLAPGEPAILSELSAALEATMGYGAAAMLIDRSGVVDDDPMLVYLSGFNWIMVGDVARARARVQQLDGVLDPNHVHMRDSLAGMVRRADALAAAGIELGDRALTGWHAALDGSLLLHESPYGHDEPMRGRYAYVSDSPGLMREGLERLALVLGAAGSDPPCVIAAPDRASSILAIAAGRILGRAVVPWSPSCGAGLVVAWNLDTVADQDFLEAMQWHRAGQILFAHASAWVDPFPYAPDVTTLLGQTITHPWEGGALRIDPDTKKAVAAEPDERAPEVLATEIVDAPALEESSASSIDLVLTIERALAGLPEADRLGLRRSDGRRLRQRAGSAVPSARFT